MDLFKMDQRVKEKLDAWETQIDTLHAAEQDYLNEKASFEHYEAGLILRQDSKYVSEKEIKAKATEDWISRKKKLIEVEIIYQREKRRLDKKIKDYEAEYGSFRREEEAVRKYHT